MKDFDPRPFERVIRNAPDRTRNDTQLLVLRAINGISRVFEPDEAPILPVDEWDLSFDLRDDVLCRSNPSRLLDAADINASIKAINQIENG